MFRNELRPYEISLWTLQDSFISVLKSYGIFHKGQIETPRCQIKNDDTQELSFSIPMYYRENGVLVENPIWYNVINGALIVNLRKLKVIFNKGEVEEEVFEFVINNVTETHADGQLHCEVTAEGLAFQELGKIGYKISLASQDFLDEYNEWYETTVGINSETEQFDFQTQEEKEAAEPINNINYWCEKIFTNSKWDYEIQMDWSAFDGITEKLDNETREEQGLRRTDKVYEEEYISSWQLLDKDDKNSVLVPAKLESFKEKLRLVDLEKSNIYNLTQDLAKAFGIFCKYKYEYDENYHIIGKKCIFYNNFLFEKDGKIDIIYPYDTSKIAREINSADIVTKMFVTPMEDNTSPSGLITIADVAANKMREDYILNFDYLYSIGTITQEQYDYIADYERSMYLANIELEPLAMQIANLQNDLVKYQAQEAFAREAKVQDKEQMDQAKAAKETVMNDKPFLVKSKENPIRGTLLKDQENGTYYVNITQQGIDYKGEHKYLLSEYSEIIPNEEEGKDPIVTLHRIYAKGIRLFYYAKVDETINKVLKAYEDNIEDNPDKVDDEEPPNVGGIYPSSVKMEIKNGNLTRLTGLQLKEDAISNSIFIACAYSPELFYQNIYNFYLEELAKHEALEAESIIQIEKTEKTIQDLTKKYEEILLRKELLIADFENMMGPALREGSWQADSYTDYGSKYEQEINTEIKNPDSHINFIWDTEPFEEEQLLYYLDNSSTDEDRKTYYYAIDLSGEIEQEGNDSPIKILDNINRELKPKEKQTVFQS